MTPATRPALDGVRVVELGTLIAGPFCGQLLGDLGADVVKIEDPRGGDPMRRWGRADRGTTGLWWPTIARNKRSVTLDLRDPSGQDVARRLLGGADVVVENFRPGTLERWGLGYDSVARENPSVVFVRVSGFGQSGPYAERAGFGSIGEAMGGLRYVTGDPEHRPSRTGISLGDSLAAVFGTIGALAALHERERSGRGQVVDVALYESVLAVMESLLPDYTLADHVRERSGATLPGAAPSNVYPTRDGDWLVIGANADGVFRRLVDALELAVPVADARFATHEARGTNAAELDALIERRTAVLDAEDALDRLHRHGVPAGRMYRAPDMLTDPHFAARDAVLRVAHATLGEYPMQGVFPRLSRTPGAVRSLGPALGEHNRAVLVDELGLPDSVLAEDYVVPLRPPA
jgi:formyl-CoA transferase